MHPEERARRSAAATGAGNRNAKKWRISFEDGQDPVLVTSLRTWCGENGHKYNTLYMRWKLGHTVFRDGVHVEQI